MKHILFYLLPAILLAMLTACGSDSDDDNGAGNTSDIAVTGKITEIGMTYAQADGYVNLDKLSADNSGIEIGIEYHSKDNGTGSSYSRTTGVEGRKINVRLTGLSPNENYTYRTYVKSNGIYHYGKEQDFTTTDGHNISTTGNAANVAFFTASIDAKADWSSISQDEDVSVGIAYSTSSQDLTDEGISRFGYDNERGFLPLAGRSVDYSANLAKLAPNTHYYYCACTQIGSTYYTGEIKDFTTKNMSDYVLTGDASNIKACTAEVTNQYKIFNLFDKPLSSTQFYVTVAKSEEELADTTKRVVFSYGLNPTPNQESAASHILNLLPKTKYYYQAVAKIKQDGYTYEVLGEVKSFTTKDIQQTGAVDLGLSCLWSAFDLGSNTPNGTGDLYAFAETETKKEFSVYNYAYQAITDFYNIPQNISGTKYDAATKKLGSSWRMPTKDEVSELLKNCHTIEGDYNGVHGIFYAAENGNAIFLPGHYPYWTSCFNWRAGSIQPQSAYCFSTDDLYDNNYYNGGYIRPVTNKK